MVTAMPTFELVPKTECATCRTRDLSNRERQVLALLASGYRAIDVADELGVTYQTAKNHITHVYDKLGVQSRVSAVLVGIDAGLIRREGGGAHG